MALFKPSHLARPTALSEAMELLSKSEGKARLVAGDTTLYDLAQHGGLDEVDTLVDISGLGLGFIQEKEDSLLVGAATTFSELSRYSLLPSRGLQALFETAGKITPPQVRNMGTIGGSLCSGIPFLDMPTTILALDGVMHVESIRGKREIKATEHFVDYFQTAVEPDEILTSLALPYSPRGGSAFIKLGRVTIDFAVVNAAAALGLDSNSRCVEARVALGAVANTPVRWSSLEEELVGKKLDHETIVAVMQKAVIDWDPSPTLGAPSEYKKLVIPTLVRDCLVEALKRAKSE